MHEWHLILFLGVLVGSVGGLAAGYVLGRWHANRRMTLRASSLDAHAIAYGLKRAAGEDDASLRRRMVRVVTGGMLLALAMTGCAAPVAAETPTPAAEVAQDPEPWRACVLDRPVCVEAVYCDADALENDPRCFGYAEDACAVRPVPKGEQCLDVNYSSGVGHCDGKGACR